MTIEIDFNNRDALSIADEFAPTKLNWLMEKRQQALSLFQTAPLPTRKIEHWKYNDMTFLRTCAANIAAIPQQEIVANSLEHLASIGFEDKIELLFVDGYLVTNLENLKLVEGIKLTRFSEANTEQQAIILSQLDPEFSSKNLLANLNTSVVADGLLIQTESNCHIDIPVYIRHISSKEQSKTIKASQTIVALDKSSALTVVEHFASQPQEASQLSLNQTLIKLEANSQLTHYRLNLEDQLSRQVSQVKSSLHKDAVLNGYFLGLGSKLNRTDIDVLHQGTHAECNLTGIYLPKNNQAIDYHSNIEHQVPHCNTQEVFRGIIADSASATFNGKIHIFQDAQKSDAQLNNKNLLLTNQAEINTKPELEIYADDVSCAHGATVAQLDDKSVYYLQSRGINKLRAQKMLSIAFVQELLNKIPDTYVKDFLCDLVENHMSQIDQ